MHGLILDPGMPLQDLLHTAEAAAQRITLTPMNRLLETLNRLSDIAARAGDDLGRAGSLAGMLPSIAVVGGRSTGKSSLLEAIVGQEFLPRGNGMVTRCPLELRLKPFTDAERAADEVMYATFGHTETRFVDFKEVRREIEQETIRRCGQNGISLTPIILEIVGSGRPALTLVDLPGLTRNPMDGQPDNIVHDIEEMVREYVEVREHCIILAVSQANADLAGSEGLRMARAVDPRGERTIGELAARCHHRSCRYSMQPAAAPSTGGK